MPRARSQERDRAFDIWRDSNGTAKLKDIADALGVSEGTVRGWKAKDRWEQGLKGTLQTSKRNAPKKRGAPKGNKNAVGNRGGAGGPVGNRKAEKHGFFAKVLPPDPELLEIMEHVAERSPLDILWDNIRLQYMVIIRAQKLMYVKDKDDLTQVLKRQRNRETEHTTEEEAEYELQFAWDKHATMLAAQSRAMAELRSMIKQYDELARSELATEEQKLRVAKLRAEINRLEAPDKDEGNVESLARILRDSVQLIAQKEDADVND